MYVVMYVYKYNLILYDIRLCSRRVENILTLGTSVVLFPPPFNFVFEISNLLLASERSERDTLRSVQLRIGDINVYNIVRANFVLITRREGGA